MKNDLLRNLILCLASSLFLAACGTQLPFPGLTTEEVYALGLQAVEQEQWEDAVESFEYVLFSPGFNRGAEARFLLAEAQYAHGDSELLTVMRGSKAVCR